MEKQSVRLRAGRSSAGLAGPSSGSLIKTGGLKGIRKELPRWLRGVHRFASILLVPVSILKPRSKRSHKVLRRVVWPSILIRDEASEQLQELLFRTHAGIIRARPSKWRQWHVELFRNPGSETFKLLAYWLVHAPVTTAVLDPVYVIPECGKKGRIEIHSRLFPDQQEVRAAEDYHTRANASRSAAGMSRGDDPNKGRVHGS